jgi:hypothetical protein
MLDIGAMVATGDLGEPSVLLNLSGVAKDGNESTWRSR